MSRCSTARYVAIVTKAWQRFWCYWINKVFIQNWSCSLDNKLKISLVIVNHPSISYPISWLVVNLINCAHLLFYNPFLTLEPYPALIWDQVLKAFQISPRVNNWSFFCNQKCLNYFFSFQQQLPASMGVNHNTGATVGQAVTGRRSEPPWRTCSWDHSRHDAIKGDPEEVRPDLFQWPQAPWGQYLCGPWERTGRKVAAWKSRSPRRRCTRWSPLPSPLGPPKICRHIRKWMTTPDH